MQAAFRLQLALGSGLGVPMALVQLCQALLVSIQCCEAGQGDTHVLSGGLLLPWMGGNVLAILAQGLQPGDHGPTALKQ